MLTISCYTEDFTGVNGSALSHEKQREDTNHKPEWETSSLEAVNEKNWSLDKPAELHGELGLTAAQEPTK